MIAIALASFVSSAIAQDPPKPVETPKTSVPLPAGDGDVTYLLGPDGKPVPVPLNATLKDFLKYIQDQQAARPAAPPAFGVSSLAIEGTADDERMWLTARVGVQVNQEGWVLVPLSLAEGFLITEPEYAGAGEMAPGEYDARSGFSWRLKGKGEHTLLLRLTVPLRKSPLSRRGLLSLPTTAVSSLKLRLPAVTGLVPAMERATIQIRENEGAEVIEAFGLGQRLDLSWQPQPETSTAPRSLETTTALLATIVDAQTMSLESNHTVKAIRGTLDVMRVQFPPGVSPTGNPRPRLWIDGEELTELRPDPADPQTAIVALKKPTAGPIQFRWRGSRTVAGSGPIAVEGLRIEGTDLHSGFLAVAVVGDFAARHIADAEPSVERVSPASLPAALRETQVSAAFRILRQPFRLQVSLQKIEPFLTVEPQAWLHCLPGFLDVDLQLGCRVYRGSVTSLRVDWPDWQSARWSLETIDPPSLIDSVEHDATGMLVRFAGPVKGPFELRLRARRPLAEATATMDFPRVAGVRAAALELVLTTADNLQADAATANGLSLVALPSASALRRPPPAEALKFPLRPYRLEPGETTLALKVVPHEREVTAQSMVRLSPERGRVNVTQRIRFHVQYERLSQLQFQLESGTSPDQVRFFLKNAELVSTVIADQGATRIVVPLDQPRLGRIELEARYRLDDPSPAVRSELVQVTVPILVPLNVALTETRVEWSGSAFEADVPQAGWVRQAAVGGAPAWTSQGVRETVSLQLRPAANPSLRGAVASRGLILSRLDSSGQLACVARYRLAGGFGTVRWRLPASAELDGVWINRAPAAPVEQRAGDRREFSISGLDGPPQAAGDERLLTIAYHLAGAPLHRFADQRTLAAPEFVGVWSTQVVWDVELPESHCLLLDPAEFDSENAWTLRSFGWERTPRRSVESLSGWIGSDGGPAFPALSATGRRYQFHRLGLATELPLTTITGSGIVFSATAACALVGLLLLRWSRTRTMLTLLAVALVVSAAGVWYPSAVLALLQPGLAGVALAVVFSAIQHAVSRRRSTAITLASSNAFPIPQHSSIRDVVAAVGSNEQTRVRLAAPSEVNVETGSRA